MCSFYVQRLAADADNILKDNYVSVGYARHMASAIDAMHASVLARALGRSPEPGLFDRSKSDFEKNFSLEEHNITEPHEKDYVQSLGEDYREFLRLSDQMTPGSAGESLYFSQLAPTYARIGQSLYNIFDVNMQAILRKNQLAKESAKSMSQYMLAIGVFSLLLALAYFWYFPFYVSNSLAYLANRVKGLVEDSGLESRTKTDDELLVIMNSIDLLRSRWKPTERNKQEEP
jgi:two-component system, NtrC family, sensor histidine kinase KinB